MKSVLTTLNIEITTKNNTQVNSFFTGILILWFLLCSFNCYSQETDSIRIAFSNGDPPTSYTEEKTTALGILPELGTLLFEEMNNFDAEMKPYPWQRAKLLVANEEADGLITYPSGARKKFMIFSEQPLYEIDYNYIIYHKNNSRSSIIKNAKSREDLLNLVLISDADRSDTTGWEAQNIPKEIKSMYVNETVKMFHLLFLRQSADFFIRNLEEARFIANKLGYGEKLAFKKVDFFTENTIPFHLGIRKSHPEAQKIIHQADEIMRGENFKRKAQSIIKRYQEL